MRVALLVMVCLCVLWIDRAALADEEDNEWERRDCAEMGFQPYPGMKHLIDRFGPGECSRTYSTPGRHARVQALWRVGNGSHFWVYSKAPYSSRVYFRAGQERNSAERLRQWLRETSDHETNVSELHAMRGGYFFTYEIDAEKPLACFMYSAPVGSKHRGYSSYVELKQCRDGAAAWSVAEVEDILADAHFKSRYE